MDIAATLSAAGVPREYLTWENLANAHSYMPRLKRLAAKIASGDAHVVLITGGADLDRNRVIALLLATLLVSPGFSRNCIYGPELLSEDIRQKVVAIPDLVTQAVGFNREKILAGISKLVGRRQHVILSVSSVEVFKELLGSQHVSLCSNYIEFPVGKTSEETREVL